MNLFELIKGTKYRRKSWGKSKYIQQMDDSYFTCFDSDSPGYLGRQSWTPSVEDLKSDDWEII